MPIIQDNDPKFQWNYLEQNHVRFIVTGLEEESLTPMFKQFKQQFLIYAYIGGAEIWKVEPAGKP